MKRWSTCVGMVAWLLAGRQLDAGTEFSFVIPKGWMDLSPTAPAGNFQGLPEHVTKEAMSDRYLAFAVNRAAGTGEVDATFNAIRLPSRGRMTDERLDRIVEGARSTVLERGASFEVIERSLIPVAGATAGRVTYEVVVDETRTRVADQPEVKISDR